MGASGVCAIVRWDDASIPPDTAARMAAAAGYRGVAETHDAPHAQLAQQSTAATGGGPPPARGSITVAASARIDNRDEILALLSAHLSRADPSDPELILAAHLRWGDDAPRHLLGDFAYVVVDDRRRTILAVRDPLAMRPLYVHHTARRTLLASEIQQLLAADDVPVEIHEPMVARYLVGEFGAPGETFFRDVQAVPAGHVLAIDAAGPRLRRFWDVDPDRRERYRRESDYAERFRELFVRSVADRMRAPGPHGLLLSGGVDSGSVGAAAGWLHEQGRVPEPLRAYSWAFPTLPQCDERHLSGLLVARYGMPLHEVDAEASPPLARYPDHGPHRDEPYLGVYQPLIETTAALARADGMRALWSGDRGDLLMGAWAPDAFGLLRRRRWADVGDLLRDDAGLPGRGWPAALRDQLLVPGLEAAGRALGRSLRRRPRRGPRQDPRRPPWLRPDLYARVGFDPDDDLGPQPPAALAGYARRERYRLVFLPMHMRGMAWSERTNAAFGLGFVDAWSDRRLVEYVLAIPQAALDRPRQLRKRLAREAMRGIMPEELRRSAAKIVPSPLFHRALREQGVATVRSLLHDMEAERRGFLDGTALREHYAAVVAGGNAHATLWWALSLEMWLRRYWR